MRLTIGDHEYQGTPDEIAHLLSLTSEQIEQGEEIVSEFPKDGSSDFALEDFEPIISDSEDLRRKLTQDPNYSPFGGVVPSKDSELDADTSATRAPFGAEEDTGVELK